MDSNTELAAELATLRAFLYGTGKLDGASFGDRRGTGLFWWRRYLGAIDDAITALTQPAEQIADGAVGVSQRDRDAAEQFLREWCDYPNWNRELQQAFARHAQQARAQALEEAAVAMENLCFFTPVEDLLGMTKQEMSVRTCREGATAIRALNGQGGGV